MARKDWLTAQGFCPITPPGQRRGRLQFENRGVLRFFPVPTGNPMSSHNIRSTCGRSHHLMTSARVLVVDRLMRMRKIRGRRAALFVLHALRRVAKRSRLHMFVCVLCAISVRDYIYTTIFHFAVFLLLILLAHVCRQVPRELFMEALPRLYFCVRVRVQLLPLPLSETIS